MGDHDQRQLSLSSLWDRLIKYQPIWLGLSQSMLTYVLCQVTPRVIPHVRYEMCPHGGANYTQPLTFLNFQPTEPRQRYVQPITVLISGTKTPKRQ